MTKSTDVGRFGRLMGAVVGVLAPVALILETTPAISAPPSPTEDIKSSMAKWDKGPETIDVTNYPVALRESYTVFAARCARCHNVSRAINADYVLPDQWDSCITRMMNKWFSGINEAKSKQILDFLIYDSGVRKKTLLDAALAGLSAEDRKAAEDRITEVRTKYEKNPTTGK